MAARTSARSAASTEKAIPSLVNVGYFSDYYLGYRLDAGLGDLYATWDAAEKLGEPTSRTRLRSLGVAFDKLRIDAAATAPSDDVLSDGRLDIDQLPADAVEAQQELNDAVLAALGWPTERVDAGLTSGDLTIAVPVAHRCETHSGLLLMALDGVFSTEPSSVMAGKDAPSGRLLEPILVNGKPVGRTALEAAQIIFTADEPPQYLLVASGGAVTLLDRDRWGEGVLLGVDLDDALARHDDKPKGELAAIAALFSAEAVNPGDAAQSTLAGLLEKAATESAGVSKELRHGMRRSVELLANAVVEDMRERQKVAWTTIDPKDLTRQCLRYLYRVIVLLFAESRPELGILPVDDSDYQAGYSLARLRDTALVDLHSDHARNARHIQHSLDVLFRLVNEGHEADMTLESHQDSRDLEFPGLRSALFGPKACELVDRAHLPDSVLQQVLAHLCFTREKAGSRRQAVSYSTLGINQLGAVYEGLMAYSGFLATEPLYEVDKDDDPDNGSWVIPVDRASEFDDDVFLTEEAPDGSRRRVSYREGDFVFRLSGRDRQRSASYYTPEVLTEFTVRHALEVLFEEHGDLTSADVLRLTVCEPALGSGAFANEAVNQLAARYLKLAQDERGETIDADRYPLELQKAKAHFAVNQVYGVDLNQTAVELAEVSLWLNCMHPGLRAPWFGARLRRGNSLIGARRATYSVDQVRSAAYTGKSASAPGDQAIGMVPLGQAPGIHHFLLPGEGWGAAAGATEVKELSRNWVDAVKSWQNAIARKPNERQLARLQNLAERVETLWSQSATEVAQFWEATRQHIDVWGATTAPEGNRFGDDAIRRVLHDPRSATFRLRAVMNAWCSLWMWGPDHGSHLPGWEEWLSGLEALLRVEERPFEPGVLFNDERELDLRAEELTSVNESLQQFPWLATCQAIAEEHAWFHWELEFSPVFGSGGFDLQVGNPPWVRPSWDDGLALGEIDPAVAFLRDGAIEWKAKRQQTLVTEVKLAQYLHDRTNAAGQTNLMSARTREPLANAGALNLYVNFMTTSWRRCQPEGGVVGLLHPVAHLSDTDSTKFRGAAYSRLRRHWQFTNEAKFFPDIGNVNLFSVNVYASSREPDFLQCCHLVLPQTLDRSLLHDGSGDLPSIQHAEGGWDVRPHRERIVRVDLTRLQEWSAVFEPDLADPRFVRQQRPVTSKDADALAVFSHLPQRLGDRDLFWSPGFNETSLQRDGIARRATVRPGTASALFLQGPHILGTTVMGQQPRPECRNHRDWEAVDLPGIDEDWLPRTNYQPLVPEDEVRRRGPQWGEASYSDFYRVVYREFVQPGRERTLRVGLAAPGMHHVHSVNSIRIDDDCSTLRVGGLLASIPYDFFIKVGGTTHISKSVISLIPIAKPHPHLDREIVRRFLRLSAMTRHFEGIWNLWRDRHDPAFPSWSMRSRAESDLERWRAHTELDALVSLAIAMPLRDLIHCYQSMFSVLRRYETDMAFDSSGRRAAKDHNAYGFVQAQWEGEYRQRKLARGEQRRGLWDRVEDALTGVPTDPLPLRAPFIRADRVAAMTAAYWTFVDQYELSPPDLADRPT